MEQWERATTGLRPPFAVVDLAAFDANADDLVRRASGLPIRVASKSVRCRALLERVLPCPGFRGVMAYSVREALWLVGHGCADVFVAYPSVDLFALGEVVADETTAAQITVCLDSAEHVARLAGLAGHHRLRVAIDVDASLRVGPAHLGVRRSPLREPADVRAVSRVAQATGRLRVVGLMFYDAQIAGLPDASRATTLMKRASAAELRRRRRHRFAGGDRRGPGDHPARRGSGLYGPTLFDGYDAFTPRPAAAFALEVVRRPAPDWVTLFPGGYIASGPTGPSRQPSILAPAGLTLTASEGAGEVQTPVRVPASMRLELGDRVWLRHAKAGELCERFDALHSDPGRSAGRHRADLSRRGQELRMTQREQPMTWSNWGGNQRSTPTMINTPADEAEIGAVVVRAAEAGLSVRAVGSGHSFTPVAATDGVQLRLSTAYDRDTAYVAVHQYHRTHHPAYFAAFEAIARAHAGRPHWGKLHSLGRADLTKL